MCNNMCNECNDMLTGKWYPPKETTGGNSDDTTNKLKWKQTTEINNIIPKHNQFLEDIKAISDEIQELLNRKNSDYGDDNLVKYGELGIIIRMSDKLARLENLRTNKIDSKVDDETVEDTLKDLAGYCINYIRLLREGRLDIIKK